MRILDSKDEADRRIIADAPTIGPYLTDGGRRRSMRGCSEHLARFGVPFRENPRIVRGLDYYGHTAFEFVTTKLGAQGTVMAGGRYDGLVAEMGGPPTPAVGWAAGIERLAMLLDASPTAAGAGRRGADRRRRRGHGDGDPAGAARRRHPRRDGLSRQSAAAAWSGPTASAHAPR